MKVLNRWTNSEIGEFNVSPYADLRGANLRGANLSGANLSGADLRDADLIGANLSDAIGLNLSFEFFETVESTPDGYVLYKTFGEHYSPNKSWNIEAGGVLTDNANACRADLCGCGINVATPKWIISETSGNEIWACLIRWAWLPGVTVPYNTDGKIRCERVELIRKYTREEFIEKFGDK